METEQIKLQLTDDKEVLEAMRYKKSLLKAPKGHEGEIFEIMFASRPIQFRILKTGEKTILPLNASIANALRRDSKVLIGDPLTGEYRPALVEVGRYSIAEGDPTLRFTKTTCPFCRMECVDARRLAYHLSHQCESEEAQVPKFNKEREEAAKRKADSERIAAEGPSEREIQSTMTGGFKTGLVREELPKPVTVPEIADESLQETE